jgi:hypothetical protein
MTEGPADVSVVGSLEGDRYRMETLWLPPQLPR